MSNAEGYKIFCEYFLPWINAKLISIKVSLIETEFHLLQSELLLQRSLHIESETGQIQFQINCLKEYLSGSPICFVF